MPVEASRMAELHLRDESTFPFADKLGERIGEDTEEAHILERLLKAPAA